MSDLPANIDGRLGHHVTVVDGGGLQIEGRLIAYAPQPSVIIERADGARVSYPVTMVQQRPLRERVAELIDEAHGEWPTEGGCDFEAYHRPDRPGAEPRYDEVVDKIIALVRSEPDPYDAKRSPQPTCSVCGGYGHDVLDGWKHHPQAGADHPFVVA